ncbi:MULTISPECIES: CsbD family protein [unclassified Sphingomonas]|uniref:CsbD family protein n=1 Tax=unclassified Sphingomonas TaxID=196159 RepID=UPI001F560734|nr:MULTISPECIES: CsbD family protein [unclassified Sphingomonas]
MDTHQVTGEIKHTAGALEEGFGRLTGDRTTEVSGAARKVAGQLEGAYGDAVSATRATVEHSPLLALGITAAAGFLLGALVTGLSASKG